MAVYSYRARTLEGHVRKGIVEGTSEQAALRHIESLRLIPVRICRKDGAGRGGAFSSFHSRVSLKDLTLFSRQTQTLLDAGISLTASLGILAEQSQSEVLKRAILTVREDIQGGSSLSEALAKQKSVFPKVVTNLIRAGEESGLLSEMLDRTATLLEFEMDNRARIKSAVFYPALVISEMLLAVFVLLKFVLPKFAGFFSRFETDLPMPTRVLMVVGSAAEKYWFVALAGFAVLAGLAVMVLRTRTGTRHFDRLKLRTPIMGSIFLKSIMSRFSHVLSALVGSGLPITECLDIVKGVVGNTIVEEEIEQMKDAVVKGQGLAAGLKASKVFSPLVVKMIAVGEETGALETMLQKASRYYDRELEHAVKNLATAIEPVLLVVLGAGVLFVALAIFLPMWNLMNAFRH
ncbi:MAG: type II secretion system F family protein [Candidatus Eisenbacteria bacterium]